MLVYKSEQYEKMVELAKKPTPDLENEPEPRLPSLDPDAGTRSASKPSAGYKRKDHGKGGDDDDDNDG